MTIPIESSIVFVVLAAAAPSAIRSGLSWYFNIPSITRVREKTPAEKECSKSERQPNTQQNRCLLPYYSDQSKASDQKILGMMVPKTRWKTISANWQLFSQYQGSFLWYPTDHGTRTIHFQFTPAKWGSQYHHYPRWCLAWLTPGLETHHIQPDLHIYRNWWLIWGTSFRNRRGPSSTSNSEAEPVSVREALDGGANVEARRPRCTLKLAFTPSYHETIFFHFAMFDSLWLLRSIGETI